MLLATLNRIKVSIKDDLSRKHNQSIASSIANVFNALADTLEIEIRSGKFDIKETNDD